MYENENETKEYNIFFFMFLYSKKDFKKIVKKDFKKLVKKQNKRIKTKRKSIP